jgi:hypothetical protein
MTALVLVSAAVFGHGAITYPPPRNAIDSNEMPWGTVIALCVTFSSSLPNNAGELHCEGWYREAPVTHLSISPRPHAQHHQPHADTLCSKHLHVASHLSPYFTLTPPTHTRTRTRARVHSSLQAGRCQPLCRSSRGVRCHPQMPHRQTQDGAYPAPFLPSCPSP